MPRSRHFDEPPCPLLDAQDKVYLKIERETPDVIADLEMRLKRGDRNKDIAQDTGYPTFLISRVKGVMDPQSDHAKRIANYKAWKLWKGQHRAKELNEAREERKRRHALKETQRKYFDPKETYDDFLKRMRGQKLHKRIPLLDYTDENVERLEREKQKRIPGLYRRMLREHITVEEQVAVLARLVKSDDDNVALRAIQELHKVQGVQRKPREAKEERAGGPMFSLSGGIGVQLAPVDDGDGETKH